MTDVKRHFDDLERSMSPIDGKKHTRPGRKPIDNEASSKRTAQNRAAQRAYRERKERKMKDLEDKVHALEQENVKVSTESDFLRAQIDMLKNELTKYRGSEINLPTSVGKLSHPVNSNSSATLNSKLSFSDSRSLHSTSSPDTEISEGMKSDFPWSKNNLQLNRDNVPDLVSGSSDSSPLNDNILFESGEKFDEKLDPFCNQLNEACGTKECPVPKYKAPVNEITSDYKVQSQGLSPFNMFNNDQLFNDSYGYNTTPNAFNNDPLSFLNDNNFDADLAFDDSSNKVSPIDNLVTEESMDDPLRDQTNSNFNFNDFLESSLQSPNSQSQRSEPEIKQEPEDEVVPAPAKTFKCSEIWDRITSHPRYTEIDIDGLCTELKMKAKCSERGAVVNAQDVNALLEKSAARR